MPMKSIIIDDFGRKFDAGEKCRLSQFNDLTN